ncbi:MAG: hypothetical protein EA426_05465 [Spirochaetaceae bacterium]|nr:MAG: hypothetical protein EA426_05465 [Spirochaetaceae bacterium]
MRRTTATLILLLAAGAAHVSADTVFVVTATTGRVEYTTETGTWRTAFTGRETPVGTTVATHARAQVELTFAHHTVTAGGLTHLTIDVAEHLSDGVDAALTVVGGRVIVEHVPDGETFSILIESPFATLTARDASFVFDGRGVSVTRGEVVLMNPSGRSVVLRSGEASRIVNGTRPAPIERARELRSLVSPR